MFLREIDPANFDFLYGAFRQGLQPPPNMSVSDWADEFRYLSTSESNKPGPWETEFVPHMREPMNVLSHSEWTKKCVIMAHAQGGKSEFLLNLLGYYAHLAPCPMMYVGPSRVEAVKFAKTRIRSMFAQSPALKSLFVRTGSGNREQNVELFTFTGGYVVVAYATSANAISSYPIRVVVLDEIDRYPVSADDNGDPVRLAEQRTVSFKKSAKILLISTPVADRDSRIEKAYRETDQRNYFVPCPHCGHFQVLQWDRLEFDQETGQNCEYRCEGCLRTFGWKWMHEIRKKGDWRPTAKSIANSAGFWFSGMISPFTKWEDLAVEYIQAKNDPLMLKPFWNLKLGLPFKETESSVPFEVLSSRREDFNNTMPEGVKVLTMGVDTQDDRLECHVVGWGDGEEAWSLDYTVLHGDPSSQRLWDDLEEHLKKRFYGGKVSAVCVDTGGHFAGPAITFTNFRRIPNVKVYGIKGVGGEGKPIFPLSSSLSHKHRGRIYLIGTYTINDLLFARLRIPTPGPGFFHFPKERDEHFFKQLLSEEKKISVVGGRRKVVVWEDSFYKQEVLHTTRYALAALYALRQKGLHLSSETPIMYKEEPIRRGTNIGDYPGAGSRDFG